MSTGKIKLAALLPALALFLTCSLPPYDEGLSLGLQTANKMVDLGARHITVGPIRTGYYDFRNREYFFIPNKGIADVEFKSGFVVRVSERSLDLSYVFYDEPSDSFTHYWSWGTGITNEDPKRLNFRAETIKWGSFLNLIRFDARDYWNNQYFLIEWNGGFNAPDVLGTTPSYPEGHLRSFIHSDYEAFNTVAGKEPTIVGSSIWPRPEGDGFDDQVFFCKLDVSGLYAEVLYYTDLVDGLVPQATTENAAIILDNIDFSFPDDFENAFYYHNGNVNVSFLSYYSKTQQKYKNYSWDLSGLLKPLVEMNRRIDATVTSGELLSFENNRCYVYDSNGERQYDFLLGGLHYCYEIYLGGVPHLIFTLPAWLTVHDHEDELYFYVYAFPTDRLSELQ